MVFVNRKSVTFPKIVQKHGGRKQEPWQPGGLRWSQQGTLGTAEPVEAGAVGEHGRPRLAGRSAVRAVVGPPRASGIGEDRVRSPSRAGGTAWTLWPAVIGGLRCCGAAF